MVASPGGVSLRRARELSALRQGGRGMHPPNGQPAERRWTMVPDRITCVCPECRANYRVRASALG
ncbi:MAG TPA: hypothetical protein PLC79_07580, partial [Phycisphaerae bacterium]|nr:hypothetical protein [Phycisphaerae bacterium]